MGALLVKDAESVGKSGGDGGRVGLLDSWLWHLDGALYGDRRD